MSKNSLALTSLIAAIPGLILAGCMVMAFTGHAGGWSLFVQGLAGVMLLVGGTLAALPAVVFLSDRPRKAAPPKEKRPEPVAAREEPPSSAVVASDDEASFEIDETQVGDSEEFIETLEEGDGTEEFDFGDEDTSAKKKKK